jgi:hypothetical protein
VPADDLRVFGELIRARGLEPVGEARVQIRPRLLRECVVGGIADQEVAELERLLTGEVRAARPHELLPDELEEDVRDAGRQRRRRQLLQGGHVEDLADHRGAADDRALVGTEPLEARCEQGVDAGRDVGRLEVARGDPPAVDLLETPLVDQH